MIYLVNSHANATSKRRHLWEIDLRFALDSTPGWIPSLLSLSSRARDRQREGVDAAVLEHEAEILRAERNVIKVCFDRNRV